MTLSGNIQVYDRHVRDVRAAAAQANFRARQAAGLVGQGNGTLSRLDSIHGMTPAEVERLRDRFEKFLPNLANGAAPQQRAAQFFEGMLPDGANLDPNAGAGFANATARHASMRRTAAGGLPSGALLSGGSGGGSFQTNQRPYQPEFESPDRQNYPIHRNLANIYWRIFYKLDPIIGTCVDLFCLPPGEQVVTLTDTANIEDLHAGDEVLGPDGKPTRVLASGSRDYDGELFSFIGAGLLPFTTTDSHPILIRSGHRVRDVRSGGHGRWEPQAGENAYVVAEKLTVGDYLVLPKLPTNDQAEVGFDLAAHLTPSAHYNVDQLWDVQKDRIEGRYGGNVGRGVRRFIPVDDDLCELLGWYAAEGSHSRDNVTFSLNNTTERHHAERLTELAMRVFDLPRDAVNWSSTANNSLRVTICRGPVAAFFGWSCGSGAENKVVPAFLLDGRTSWRQRFLAAYFAGDGCESDAWDVSAGTVSRTLAVQVQLLGLALGLFFRVNFVDKTNARRKMPTADIRDAYCVVAPRRVVHPKAFGKTFEDDKRSYPQRAVDCGTYWLTPIRKIEREAYVGPVYDIKTEAAAFCLPAVVHNSEMPWSDFQLTGEGVDGEIKDALEFMCEETQFRAMLPYLIREFLVIGEVAPHLFWDDDEGLWMHIALHNPDQLEVIHAPFLKMEPLVEFKPEDRLRQVLTSNNPMLQSVREGMPDEILSALTAGSNIPLSSINCTFVPRKLHPYDVRGTSIISRMWRILMYEDSIFNASIAIARRAAAPLKVAKLGDRNTGWIPDPSQERRLLELLVQSEIDPAAWLVYHYGIEFDLIGTQERAWKIDASAEFIERTKLLAMGVSKSFLHGEVTYACLPLDTPISVPDGLTRIQDAREGDRIIDGNGAEQKVVRIWDEGVPPELVELTVSGSRKVSSTLNHRWPVARGGRIQKLPANEIQVGDALLVPRTFEIWDKEPSATPEMARLVGYYAAEGNTFPDNEDETVAEDIENCIATLSCEGGWQLGQYLVRPAGAGAHEKRFSEEVMRWPLELKRELVRALVLGDGSQTLVMRGKSGPYLQCSFTTASKTLAYQTWQVLIQLGIYGSLTQRDRADTRESWPDATTHWALQFQSDYAIQLANLVWGDDALSYRMNKKRRHKPEVWMDEQYAYLPVKRVARVANVKPVFNIEVTGSHTYLAEGIATHNSAASGLTVFLQRLKAMREFFESVWIYPKFFRPVAEMNRWVKPTQAELEHKVRTRRSKRELREDRRYIMPKIEWNRPLDPSIDSAMISAYTALTGLGVKFSKTTMASLVNRDYEDELQRVLSEAKKEQQLLQQHPELQMALAPGGGEGGAGGGGDGGVAPGIPPEAMGMEPPPGDEGAPPEGGGEPLAAAAGDNEPHGGTRWDADGKFGSWSKDEALDLVKLMREGEAPEEDPWKRMMEEWATTAKAGNRSSLAALRAVASGDGPDAWEAIEEWLLVGGYPPKAVRDLEAILNTEGVLGGAKPSKALEAMTQLLEKTDSAGGDRLFIGAPQNRGRR